MRFSVTKLAQALVPPSEPTPSGNLPLSFMDRHPRWNRYDLYDSIQVFGRGEEPAKLLREALSRALVPYYPVAGRLVDSDQGEPEVACTGDGVWFVEASADCDLRDVNHLERPLLIPKQDLLPSLGTKEKDVILLMQVTRFTCGGFALGIRFNHAFFDGIGVGQFLKAVADVAKGLARPTVEPVWCREAIPDPPKPLGEPKPQNATPLELFVIDLPPDRIDQMKSQFTKATGRICTKFEILTAKVWQSLVRAINLDPNVHVCLIFTANVRHLMHRFFSLPLDGGYYGNCLYRAAVTATRGKIMNASLVEIVSLVQEAKQDLSINFSRWRMGDPAADPFKEPIRYGSLWVTDWTRLGFFELDFGWGGPVRIVPLSDDEYMYVPLCFLLKPLASKEGVRLMTRCVGKEHLPSFHDQMYLL